MIGRRILGIGREKNTKSRIRQKKTNKEGNFCSKLWKY